MSLSVEAAVRWVTVGMLPIKLQLLLLSSISVGGRRFLVLSFIPHTNADNEATYFHYLTTRLGEYRSMYMVAD